MITIRIPSQNNYLTLKNGQTKKTGRIKGGKSGRVALELLTQPIGYDDPLLLPYLHEQDTNRNEVLKANIDKWLLDSAKGFESY